MKMVPTAVSMTPCMWKQALIEENVMIRRAGERESHYARIDAETGTRIM